MQGPHFHQPHRQAGLGYLPGRLGASQAGTDNKQACWRPLAGLLVIGGIDWGRWLAWDGGHQARARLSISCS
jgi:hypothetical protein